MPEYVEGEKSSGLLRAIEKKKEIVGVLFADFYTCVCAYLCVFSSLGRLWMHRDQTRFNIYFNVTFQEKRVAERIVTRPWLAKMAIMIAQFEVKCDGFLSLFCRPVLMG